MTVKSQHSESTGGRSIKKRLIEELRHFAVLFVYLWVFLNLFVLSESVVSRQQGFSFLPHGFALLNALVLAKVMLVAEDLELARWLEGKAAIWTILFETALCSVLFICFHFLEHFV